MGRPRKPDKKIALSFRVTPTLADRIDQFATALGTTTSEAVEHALSRFFEAGMARESVLEMEARRAAAFAVIDAEAVLAMALRQVDARALPLLREHLEGATYREMVAGSDTRPIEARELVRAARAVLGDSYAVLAAKPELLDHVVPRRRHDADGRRSRQRR